MVPPPGRRLPDPLHRMSHLLAAANTVANNPALSQPVQRVLAAHLGRHLVAVGKKAKVRAAPDVKRTLCKGCRGILVPGRHANVALTGKRERRLRLECAQCATTKSFLADGDKRKARKQRTDKRKKQKAEDNRPSS